MFGEPVPWTLVKNKGRTSKVIRGTLSGNENLKAAPRTTDLFTSWWAPTTTCDNVRDFLKNAISADCTPISTRAIKYVCLRGQGG